SFAATAVFVVAAAAASSTQAPAAIPSQTLNSAQAAALATLSAAQASLNAMNSQLVANDKASQAAAIESQSQVAHSHSGSEDLGALDSSMLEGMESSIHEQSKDSAASSVAGSMLALALMAGAAMF
ncbi:hypothetical protein GGI04_005989, partial [Coemansia thaxteri]